MWCACVKQTWCVEANPPFLDKNDDITQEALLCVLMCVLMYIDRLCLFNVHEILMKIDCRVLIAPMPPI